MNQYNLAQKFYLNSVANPERIALVIGADEYSYGELATRAADLAGWIAGEFPESTTRVGILASRSLEAYVGIIASAWAGKTYVPLNPTFPESYLRKIVKRTKISSLIVDRATENLFNAKTSGFEDVRFVSPDLLVDGAGSIKKTVEPIAVSPDDLLYIMLTSGTSGEPKMIGATAANTNHFLEVSQSRYKLLAEDRLSQFNDICWDPSVFDMFAAWAVGASVYVVPAAQLLAPAHFIQEKNLSIWYSTPSQIELLTRMKLLKPGCFPSLRLSLFVGEPLTVNAALQWSKAAPNSIVENVFGPTETTVVCMGQPYEQDRPEIITPKRGYVAIGSPYQGVQVAVVDRDHHFLKGGEEGELVISGPMVVPGYLNDSELTEQKFVKLDHPERGESVWYLTGDLGYQDIGGIFHFLGRGDNQVQIFGKRVELEEIEFHLRQVANCEEAVAVGWPIKDGSAQGLIGFVSGTKVDAVQLKVELQKRLPAYMVPRKINILAEMPRNRNGKLDRKTIIKYVTGEK